MRRINRNTTAASSTQAGLRGPQAGQRALAAEHDERLEQRWSDGAPGDRDPNGCLCLAELLTVTLTNGGGQLVKRFSSPHTIFVCADSINQDRRAGILLNCLGPRRRINARQINEEEVDHVD